jgi:hypothetical protein
VALSGLAHLTWNLSIDLDVRFGGKVEFRHTSLTSNPTWSDSTPIGASVAGNMTMVTLPLLTGSYLAKFVDSTGNRSSGISSFASTTVPNIVNMNAVATSTQHPNFTGVTTNLVATDDLLKFTSGTYWDSISVLAGDIDAWDYIDRIGGIETSGTYEFDNYVDLGKVYTSRVTSSVEFNVAVIGSTIDERLDFIYDWDDFDQPATDGEIIIYIATTNDDPSATPTWSGWTIFKVADYRARAFKFKMDVSGTDANSQLYITGLAISIDCPDRVQGDAGIQTGAAVKSIAYPSSFFAVPSLGITVTDMHSNDELEITNETTTGFDVGIKHGSSYQDHKINWIARGY